MYACAFFCLLSILQDIWKWGKRNHHQLSFTARERPLYSHFSLTIYLNCTFLCDIIYNLRNTFYRGYPYHLMRLCVILNE